MEWLGMSIIIASKKLKKFKSKRIQRTFKLCISILKEMASILVCELRSETGLNLTGKSFAFLAVPFTIFEFTLPTGEID